MMDIKPLRSAAFLIVLLFASLACQLVSRVGDTKATVEAVATGAAGGANVVGTAQAVLTQAGDAGLIGTVEAAATQVGESGLMETAVEVATEQGPALAETAQAYATDAGPGAVETMQASMGEKPEDIPVIEGDVKDLLGSQFLVSYTVSMSFDQVREFYDREMPVNGWSKVEGESMEMGNMVIHVYQKGDRKATLTLTSDTSTDQTLVLIAIANP